MQLLSLFLMLPSRFSAKLTWLNAVINGHSLKEEDYKVFETSGETRPDSLRKKGTQQQPKPSLKTGTAGAIFWIYLGIFRDYGLKNISS